MAGKKNLLISVALKPFSYFFCLSDKFPVAGGCHQECKCQLRLNLALDIELHKGEKAFHIIEILFEGVRVGVALGKSKDQLLWQVEAGGKSGLRKATRRSTKSLVWAVISHM